VRAVTATEASRGFSELLDAVERGESVVVTRGGRPVAEIRPAASKTGRDLRQALAETAPPDDRFAEEIAAVRALLTSERPDPRAGA
jgi:prevent-host-death family protein